jgi:hypothetical protein
MSETCNWIENDDGFWVTGCGHFFVLDEGTPSDNQMHWCPYCGKSLQEVRKDAGINPPNIQHVPFTAAGWSGK